VISVGKINDIFVGEGITESNHSDSSVHGMQQTIDIAKRDFKGLCFTNLVDFDALWGHRRNPVGYGEEIEKFDKKLGELLPLLREDDLLILMEMIRPIRERITQESRSRLSHIHHRIRKVGSLIQVTPLPLSARPLRIILVSECRRGPSELLFWIR